MGGAGGIRLRALTLVLVLLPALVLASAPPVASAPAPCHVWPFFEGVQLVAAPPGHWVRVRFHVDEPQAGTLWAAVGWHAATTALVPPYHGHSAERAAAIGFVEDAQGQLLTSPFAFMMFPYDATVHVGDVTAHLDAQDSDSCGAAASGTAVALAPGSYVLTVLAASDLANGGGAFLPASGYVVDAVETGPATLLREDTLRCAFDAHVSMLGVTSNALVQCEQALPASGRAYHGVFSGRFPSATHDVRYDPAHGPARQVGFFDGGAEPAGVAKLLVPRYVTPAAHPFYLPVGGPGALGSDSGIFGVHADV